MNFLTFPRVKYKFHISRLLCVAKSRSYGHSLLNGISRLAARALNIYVIELWVVAVWWCGDLSGN